MRTLGTKCWALNRIRGKQKDNATECILLGYKGDHIYRLVNTSRRLIRALTVQFTAEKRALQDIGEGEPLSKRFYDYAIAKLWGGDDYNIIQATPN